VVPVWIARALTLSRGASRPHTLRATIGAIDARGHKELYGGPNGDRLFLCRDAVTGRVFIKHEPNVPLGGQSTEIDIGALLSRGPRNPEHQALLRLIGTLTEGSPDA
jgi:hypothetical protein